MRGVVGLDLSLRRTGMCYIPPDWDGSRLGLVTTSIPTEREKAAYGKPHILARIESERQLMIADQVIRFVNKTKARDVCVENYAFSTVKDKQGRPVQSSSITKLGELGGCVKTQVLLACKIPVVPIAGNTARKFLTGGLKKGGQKKQVERFLKQHDIWFDNDDEMDGFVVGYCWYGKINNICSRFLPQVELNFGNSPG